VKDIRKNKRIITFTSFGS